MYTYHMCVYIYIYREREIYTLRIYIYIYIYIHIIALLRKPAAPDLFRAKYCTPEITKVKFRGKVPPEIHDDFRGADFWHARFCPYLCSCAVIILIMTILHIYIYIYIERERERETEIYIYTYTSNVLSSWNPCYENWPSHSTGPCMGMLVKAKRFGLVASWGVSRQTSSCLSSLPSHNLSPMSYHARRRAGECRASALCF